MHNQTHRHISSSTDSRRHHSTSIGSESEAHMARRHVRDSGDIATGRHPLEQLHHQQARLQGEPALRFRPHERRWHGRGCQDLAQRPSHDLVCHYQLTI